MIIMRLLVLLPLFVTSALAICFPDPPGYNQNGEVYQSQYIQNPSLYQYRIRPYPYVIHSGIPLTRGLLGRRNWNYGLYSGRFGRIRFPGFGINHAGVQNFDAFNRLPGGIPYGAAGGVQTGISEINVEQSGKVHNSDQLNYERDETDLSDQQSRDKLLFQRPQGFSSRYEVVDNIPLYNTQMHGVPNGIPPTTCKPCAAILANTQSGTFNNLYGIPWQQIYSPIYLQNLRQRYGYDFLNNQGVVQGGQDIDLEKMQKMYGEERLKELLTVYSPQYLVYLQNIYGSEFLKTVKIDNQIYNRLGLQQNIGRDSRFSQIRFRPQLSLYGINRHLIGYLNYLARVNPGWLAQYFIHYPGRYQWAFNPWFNQNVNYKVPSNRPGPGLADRFQGEDKEQIDQDLNQSKPNIAIIEIEDGGDESMNFDERFDGKDDKKEITVEVNNLPLEETETDGMIDLTTEDQLQGEHDVNIMVEDGDKEVEKEITVVTTGDGDIEGGGGGEYITEVLDDGKPNGDLGDTIALDNSYSESSVVTKTIETEQNPQHILLSINIPTQTITKEVKVTKPLVMSGESYSVTGEGGPGNGNVNIKITGDGISAGGIDGSVSEEFKDGGVTNRYITKSIRYENGLGYDQDQAFKNQDSGYSETDTGKSRITITEEDDSDDEDEIDVTGNEDKSESKGGKKQGRGGSRHSHVHIHKHFEKGSGESRNKHGKGRRGSSSGFGKWKTSGSDNGGVTLEKFVKIPKYHFSRTTQTISGQKGNGGLKGEGGLSYTITTDGGVQDSSNFELNNDSNQGGVKYTISNSGGSKHRGSNGQGGFSYTLSSEGDLQDATNLALNGGSNRGGLKYTISKRRGMKHGGIKGKGGLSYTVMNGNLEDSSNIALHGGSNQGGVKYTISNSGGSKHRGSKGKGGFSYTVSSEGGLQDSSDFALNGDSNQGGVKYTISNSGGSTHGGSKRKGSISYTMSGDGGLQDSSDFALNGGSNGGGVRYTISNSGGSKHRGSKGGSNQGGVKYTISNDGGSNQSNSGFGFSTEGGFQTEGGLQYTTSTGGSNQGNSGFTFSTGDGSQKGNSIKYTISGDGGKNHGYSFSTGDDSNLGDSGYSFTTGGDSQGGSFGYRFSSGDESQVGSGANIGGGKFVLKEVKEVIPNDSTISVNIPTGTWTTTGSKSSGGSLLDNGIEVTGDANNNQVVTVSDRPLISTLQKNVDTMFTKTDGASIDIGKINDVVGDKQVDITIGGPDAQNAKDNTIVLTL